MIKCEQKIDIMYNKIIAENVELCIYTSVIMSNHTYNIYSISFEVFRRTFYGTLHNISLELRNYLNFKYDYYLLRAKWTYDLGCD